MQLNIVVWLLESNTWYCFRYCFGKDAICDLFVKLQYDLRDMLNAEPMMSAHDLLVMAKDKGILDGKQESALHKLRMCRNGLQHPEKSQTRFDKETIENWRDIVFAIKEEQK